MRSHYLQKVSINCPQRGAQKRKKMKKLAIHAISALLFAAFSCFYSCDDPQDEKEEDRTPLLEGIWSSDPTGISTKISIHEGTAEFFTFAGDKWQTLADAGHIKQWDYYFVNSEYQGKGNFNCGYYDYYAGSKTERRDATFNLTDDGKTLTVQTGNEAETWHKQSSQPVQRGRVSFWTDRNRGRISIEFYDGSYDFEYNPLNNEGYFDYERWEKYQIDHLIGNGSLNMYFESGVPGCGQFGTSSFNDIVHGTYKYRVSNPPYAWNGTVYLNSECVMVKL